MTTLEDYQREQISTISDVQKMLDRAEKIKNKQYKKIKATLTKHGIGGIIESDIISLIKVILDESETLWFFLLSLSGTSLGFHKTSIEESIASNTKQAIVFDVLLKMENEISKLAPKSEDIENIKSQISELMKASDEHAKLIEEEIKRKAKYDELMQFVLDFIETKLPIREDTDG